MKKATVCELCGREAVLYCPSDSAFLCTDCDDKVHRANFLVARHHRFVVCSNCTELTGNRISGVGSPRLPPICRSCSPEPPLEENRSFSSSSSSSSDCISTAESCATPPDRNVRDTRKIDDGGPDFPAKKVWRRRQSLRRVGDAEVEGILVNWCRKLGFTRDVCEEAMPLAMEAFGVCLTELTALPLRVSLVASLWLSLRLCGDRSASTWQVLKRIEELSGVSAKLILASESRLAGIFKRRAKPKRQEEEGWAESSV